MLKSREDLSLFDILPDSLSEIYEVKAAAWALDPEIKGVTQAIREALILARLDELPEPVVDLLAWQYHVDVYEPLLTMSLERKRDQVRNAILLHRHKGTKWAMRQMLDLLGYSGVQIMEQREVQEWYRQLGCMKLDGTWSIGESPPRRLKRKPALPFIPDMDHWAMFAVVANLAEFTNPGAEEEIKGIVNAMKPVRSLPVWGYRVEAEAFLRIRAIFTVLRSMRADAYVWPATPRIDGTWNIGGGTRLGKSRLYMRFEMKKVSEIGYSKTPIRLDGGVSVGSGWQVVRKRPACAVQVKVIKRQKG